MIIFFFIPSAISQPQLINTPNGPRYVVVNPQGMFGKDGRNPKD